MRTSQPRLLRVALVAPAIAALVACGPDGHTEGLRIDGAEGPRTTVSLDHQGFDTATITTSACLPDGGPRGATIVGVTASELHNASIEDFWLIERADGGLPGARADDAGDFTSGRITRLTRRCGDGSIHTGIVWTVRADEPEAVAWVREPTFTYRLQGQDETHSMAIPWVVALCGSDEPRCQFEPDDPVEAPG